MTKIDQAIEYLKYAIPNCEMTPEQENMLREAYDKVDEKDFQKAFHQAIRAKAMTPALYIIRQLNIFRPADPFKSGGAFAKHVESGVDWDRINAQKRAELEERRRKYNSVHGDGAYGKRLKAQAKEWHEWALSFEEKPDESNSEKEERQYTKEEKDWYDNLLKELGLKE